MKPSPFDFCRIFDDLSGEQKLIRDTARDFVKSEFTSEVARCFEDGTFPEQLVKRLGELGFLGSTIQGYGCHGLDQISYGLIMKELERGDSGLRSFASVQGALVMYPIFTFGSESQKNKWLPLLSSGEAIGCFGLTEPDFGSNPAGMLTQAKRKGNAWVLNGSKTWITSATTADIAVVWAKTDEGIRGFIVERGTPGFSSSEIKHKLSLRASVTGSLFFDDCEIPFENVLPKSTDLKHALMCLTQARYGIAWGAMGAAEDCLEEALQYSKSRIIHSRSLSSYQLVQAKLAKMSTDIALGNLLSMQLGRLKNEGLLHHSQVSMAKQNNVKVALETARVARDILGANGISLEYRSMRHACNLESVFTYEGTNDIHLLIVGQEITGVAAFH